MMVQKVVRQKVVRPVIAPVVRGLGRGGLGLIGALLFVGFLAVLIEVQSPSAVYWTGDRVQGYSEGGIVFYRFRDRDYTIDDTGRSAADPGRLPVSVWVDPGDPTDAKADSVSRWIDGGAVAVWFVAAAGLVPFAVVRQRRRLQRQAEFAAGH